MELAAFRKAFSFGTWFDRWREELAAPATDAWPGSIRRVVLEALSDASAEQLLNPLVASHLRRFGGELARRLAPDRVFWVRSEWAKVDLSYGLAAPFAPTPRGWNVAWTTGQTGDLGQCEVKVCYTHLHLGKLKTLAGQLEDRRERDRLHDAPGLEHLRYHGLVWLFEHGGATKLPGLGAELEAEAKTLGLVVRRPFIPSTAEVLGRIWPSADGAPYRCGMTMALLELPV